jgi:hypothetical protein
MHRVWVHGVPRRAVPPWRRDEDRRSHSHALQARAAIREEHAVNTFKFKDLMVPVLPKDLKPDAKVLDARDLKLRPTVCWKQTVVGPGPIKCRGVTLPRDPLTKLTIRENPVEELDLAALREELRRKVAVQKGMVEKVEVRKDAVQKGARKKG